MSAIDRHSNAIIKTPATWRRLGVCALLVAFAGGCAHHQAPAFTEGDLEHFIDAATQVEYADVEQVAPAEDLSVLDPTAIPDGQHEYWDLPLQEALWMALENSKVMRDLGANVLRAPEAVETIYGPALQETDPRFGIEAALSEFDAMFQGRVLSEKNDRRFNNRVFGNNGFLQQDLIVGEAEISKRSVTGSQFAVRHGVTYDRNNSVANEFPGGGFDAILEAEARQPLLQGAGVAFNRLAGPNAQPGLANGVLIARTKTDISLADFEIRVRDFLSNVENAYWDLYFAYRDLDAKTVARDKSYLTFMDVRGNLAAGTRTRADLHQAAEQYFRFQQEVVNALKGRPLDGTQTNNGSRAGTFRAVPGVRVAERRLRLLIGIPASDQRLIRPADQPAVADIIYDWDQVVTDAIGRRAELRRQRWQVKRRELELLAGKNHLLPRLDLVGRYRFRGFGDDLIDPSGDRPDRFDNAYDDLTSGDFQEWQVGIELSAPLGFRQELTAVRNAELQLAREKAVLAEQQRQILHEASNAVAEVQRAIDNYKLSHDRLWASNEQVKALRAKRDLDLAELDVVLDAERRLADAQSSFHQTQVEYAVALKNVHFEKGTLLEYCGVHLAEGRWPEKAYHDAALRDFWQTPPTVPPHVANPPLALHSPPAVGPQQTGHPSVLQVAELPQTEPPQTEPPQTEPPQTEPPQTKPPQTEPPQTKPSEVADSEKTETVVSAPPRTVPVVVPAAHELPVNVLRDGGVVNARLASSPNYSDPPPRPPIEQPSQNPSGAARIGSIVLEQTVKPTKTKAEPIAPVRESPSPKRGPAPRPDSWRKRQPEVEMIIR